MLRFVVLLLGISSGLVAVAFQQHPQPLSQKLQQRSLNRFQLHASSSRENEIKRKIQQLKRQGRIGNNNNDDVGLPASTSYEDKIREKLGTTKSRLLGFGGTQEEESIRAIQDELDADVEEDEDEAHHILSLFIFIYLFLVYFFTFSFFSYPFIFYSFWFYLF